MGAMVAHSVANILMLAGLLLLVTSFATNDWIIKRVDRTQVSATTNQVEQALVPTDPAYFTRRVGLFRECYAQDNSDINFLLSNAQDAVRSAIIDEKLGCLSVNYFIPEDNSFTSKTPDFKTRIHLMRASVAILIVSMFFILVAMIIGFVSCWKSFIDAKWSNSAKWAGIILFIAAFFNAFGIALWHGAEYMEKYRVTDDFRGSAYYFDSNWLPDLQASTDRYYSWSYYLCWVAVFIEVVSALTFYLTGWMHRPPPEKRPVFNDYPSLSSAGYRNRAYDYVETSRGHPVPDAGYVPEDYYYVSNPRAQRYSQYVPSQNYGPQGYDSDQGWRWDRY